MTNNVNVHIPLGTGDGGGGGVMVGASYLQAHTVGNSGIASGVTDVEAFTLAASAGSDFAVDGGDNTKINVANECWAILSYQPQVVPDTATITKVEGIITPFASVPALVIGEFEMEVVAANVFYPPPITTAPLFIAAGTVLGATVECDTSAGTWSNVGGNYAFQIVRLS